MRKKTLEINACKKSKSDWMKIKNIAVRWMNCHVAGCNLQQVSMKIRSIFIYDHLPSTSSTSSTSSASSSISASSALASSSPASQTIPQWKIQLNAQNKRTNKPSGVSGSPAFLPGRSPNHFGRRATKDETILEFDRCNVEQFFDKIYNSKLNVLINKKKKIEAEWMYVIEFEC